MSPSSAGEIGNDIVVGSRQPFFKRFDILIARKLRSSAVVCLFIRLTCALPSRLDDGDINHMVDPAGVG